jgi:plastocyanin
MLQDVLRHMDRRSALAALGTGVVGAVAGCTSVLGADVEYDVGMSATEFVPDVLRVDVGTEVVWYNNSSRGHTVTAYDAGIPEEAEYFASGGFADETAAREAFWDWRDDPEGTDGGMLTSGESYRHTFAVPGEYRYVCLPHEQGGMVGTVVVEE